MDNLRLSAVADRVVAWHNRHPLARRISAAQVHAIGYVALPFAAEAPVPAPTVASETPTPAQLAAEAIAAAAAMPLPLLTDVALAAATEAAEVAEVAEAADAADAANPANPTEGSRLRERALARAREQAADPHRPHGVHGVKAAALQATLAPATLKRDFSENFIDTLTPRQVARFALKQGRVLARAPLDGPVREVRADGGHRGRVPAQVYLLTAVIETDTRKSRVLLGNGPQVLGRRIHSGPRIAALAALGACVVGTPLWLLQPTASMPTPEPMADRAPGSMAAPGTEAEPALATAATAAASATLPATVGPAPPSTAPAEGPAPVVPMIEPAPSAPVEPEATTRRRVVAIVPLLSDEQKALAREQRQALMAAAAPAAPAVSVPVPALPAPPAPPAPAPFRSAAQPPAASPAPSPARAPAVLATAPTAPVFAISTRTLRTRSEADQVRVAMQSLLLTLGQEQVQVDVLPQGEDWRVVALPFPRRADAEKGRALLASRGMRVVVVDF